VKVDKKSVRQRLASAGALLVLAFVLALAYGPAKLSGHSIYGGVIQDLTNLYGFYGWDSFSASEFEAGRFPMWNPHNALGVPHLANMQTAVFYPLNWPKFMAGFWNVIDLLLMLRLFLAGALAFALARRALAAGYYSSLIGACAFMLSGYMTRYVYMSHLNVEILFPLELLLLHLLYEKPVLSRLVLAGLGMALLVLGGFPEATLYAAVFSLFYYLFVAGVNKRSIVFAASVSLFGILLSLPQWLPFAEYYVNAWTYHDASAGLRSLDPQTAISLIVPWFFGENRMSPAVPFLCPYLGAVPVMLALFACLSPGKSNRQVWFFILAAPVLLGIIYGLPVFSWVGKIFPFNLTYNEKYAVPALALAVAMLAARGADRARQEQGFFKVAIVVAMLLLWIGYSIFAGLPPRHWFRPYYALGLLKPGLVIVPAVLIIAAFAALLLYRKKALSRRAAGIALLVLSVFGLLYDKIGHKPDYHDHIRQKGEKLAEVIGASSGKYRVHASPEISEIFPNRLLPKSIDDIRYYDPLYPRSYVDYMVELNGLEKGGSEHYDDNMAFMVERDEYSGPFLRLANLYVHVLAAPIDERPLLKDFRDNALTLSSRGESWLRLDSFAAGGVSRKALMEHAPARIRGSVEFKKSLRPELLFSAGVPDNQVSATGDEDGVLFSVLQRKNGPGSSLAFARYLDPARAITDSGWHDYNVRVRKGKEMVNRVKGGKIKARIELSLLPGPVNNINRDAACFADLRLHTGEKPEDFEYVGQIGEKQHVYKDPQALPRSWWVAGMGEAEEGTDYMRSVHDIALNNPNTFLNVAVAPKKIEMEVTDIKLDMEEESFEQKKYLPGRIEFESLHERPGYIFVSEQYLPGFRAFVENGPDRLEAPVFRANGPFKVFPVPAGEWKAVLVYMPWSFRVGLFAGITSFIFLIFSFFLPERNKNR